MKVDTEKKPYTAPQLSEFGSISELTLVGATNPGGDTFGGSVTPGGGPT